MAILKKIRISASVIVLCTGCAIPQIKDINQNTTQNTPSGNHHPEAHHNDHH